MKKVNRHLSARLRFGNETLCACSMRVFIGRLQDLGTCLDLNGVHIDIPFAGQRCVCICITGAGGRDGRYCCPGA